MAQSNRVYKLLMIGGLIAAIFGCTPQQRFDRLIEKYPALVEKFDTTVKVTVNTPGEYKDTAFPVGIIAYKPKSPTDTLYFKGKTFLTRVFNRKNSKGETETAFDTNIPDRQQELEFPQTIWKPNDREEYYKTQWELEKEKFTLLNRKVNWTIAVWVMGTAAMLVFSILLFLAWFRNRKKEQVSAAAMEPP